MIDLKKYNKEEIKSILWRLCYDSNKVLEEMELKDTESKKVIEFVLKKCGEEEVALCFGDENPYFDTQSIDLGIKNPIVRDVLLEKSYSAVETSPYIKKAITLFTTDYLESLKESKVIGGLKILGFSNQEANYLYNSCNLYPIGLLLKKLVEKQEKEPKKVIEKTFKEQVKPVVVEKKKSSTTKVTTLVANKELIEEIFKLLKDEKTSLEVSNALEVAHAEVKRLQELQKLLNELSLNGISFEEIIEKKQKLYELYSAMAAI